MASELADRNQQMHLPPLVMHIDVHGHNATCTNTTLGCVTDPSAGSPTESWSRLLPPLIDEVHQTSRDMFCKTEQTNLRNIHRNSQSAGATGGVHKKQTRNQHELMTRAYWEFLAEDLQKQEYISHHDAHCRLPNLFTQDLNSLNASAWCVQPRTFTSTTDLLLAQTSLR